MLNHVHDAVYARGPRRRRDAHLEVAALKRGARVDGGAGLLAHQGGLARHGGLVYLAGALNHGAVHRKDAARAQVEHHTAGDVLGADAHVLAVHDGPHALRAHHHALAQRQVGAALHVLLHEAGELQQEGDGARLGKAAAGDGGGDGRGVQDLHGDLAGKQVPQALGHKAQGAHAGKRRAHRHGEKDALCRAPQDEARDLHLEAVVLQGDLQRALARAQARIGRRGQAQRIQPAHGGQHGLAARGLKGQQYGAVGGVDLGGVHAVCGHEGIGNAARLLVGEETRAAPQAEPSGKLRDNPEDHWLGLGALGVDLGGDLGADVALEGGQAGGHGGVDLGLAAGLGGGVVGVVDDGLGLGGDGVGDLDAGGGHGDGGLVEQAGVGKTGHGTRGGGTGNGKPSVIDLHYVLPSSGEKRVLLAALMLCLFGAYGGATANFNATCRSSSKSSQL